MAQVAFMECTDDEDWTRTPAGRQAIDDGILDGQPRQMTVPMVQPNDRRAVATDMPVDPSQ